MKQLAKLVKVRYVEDITASERVGAPNSLLHIEYRSRFGDSEDDHAHCSIHAVLMYG